MHATFGNDEHALFARLRETGDPADRERAVMRYLPLARSLAARFRRTAEPIEDLEQVAAIGLLNAIDRFDPERGTAFTTFAVPTILGELRRHFRDRTWAMRVPRDLQELALRIEKVRDDLTGSLGRQPTVAELSHHLGTSEEMALQALELSLVRHTFPLEPQRRDGEVDDTDGPGSVDDGYVGAEHRAMLVPLIASLTPREAQVVFLCFNEDLTQDAVAGLLGISQMHVSRTLHRSLARLRLAAGT